jgi:hypothetical protein
MAFGSVGQAPITLFGSVRRVTLPRFESDEPGSLHLSNEMIAEILDEDELSA